MEHLSLDDTKQLEIFEKRSKFLKLKKITNLWKQWSKVFGGAVIVMKLMKILADN